MLGKGLVELGFQHVMNSGDRAASRRTQVFVILSIAKNLILMKR
jgi:hypothetical protein